MQLKYKIPLILFAVFMLLVGTFVASVLTNSSKVRKDAQLETARATAQNYSNTVNSFMSEKIAELKGLGNNASIMLDLDEKTRAKNIDALLKKIVRHPAISDIYVNFDKDIKVNKLHLTEPYKTKYPNEKEERRVISLKYPVSVNGKIVGVAGMDFDLDILQKEFFSKMQDAKMSSYVILISNGGLRVAHPKSDLLLMQMGDDLPAEQQKDLLNAIKNGKYHLVTKKSLQTGDVSIMSYVPMQPRDLELPLSICYVVSHAALRGDELKMRYTVMSIMGVAVVLWCVFLFWLMSSVFSRIISTVKLLGKMTEGEGDLTIRLTESGKDEIGQMASGLNTLIEKLHSTVKITQKESKRLLNTSSALYELSNQLSDVSKNALEQSASASESTKVASQNAKTIASDADVTSASANELATTAEQMSLNMNSVAGAVEELSASFAQITGNTDESRKIAIEATQKSENATQVMSKLGVAATEIGQVTEVIKRIADKTNLLALNATIEAAAAGGAGKGFAVVAGEIKELANQSAKSADDIAERIEGIQNGTNNAVQVIHNVSAIISKINESIETIANSVGEQTKASNEIASNAEQANMGAKQVVNAIDDIAGTAKISAQNADNVAKGAKDISDSVNVMYDNAKESNANSARVKETANNLKSMSERLESIVSKFKT